jgi:hypothetical protein
MRNTGRVASTTSRGGTDAAAASFREKTKVQKAGHETAFQRPRRFYHPRRHTVGWPRGMTTQGQSTRQNAPGSAGTSKPGVSGLPESKSGPTVT